MSLMVSPSWHTNWLEEIYNSTTDQLQSHLPKAPSPYLCLPLMSIAKIAHHEFCTKCALYLSTTNITTSKTSQATHTRLSPMPSPSLQHCLFHQTFPYNNNNKNRNIIKNKYAECSHGRIPQVVPK
ncbi:unnamed protein product [Brassica oleracea]